MRQRSTASGLSVTQTLEQAPSAYAPASKNAQDLTAAIAYCIPKYMIPFRMVERPGFLRMMKVAVGVGKVHLLRELVQSSVHKFLNELTELVTMN